VTASGGSAASAGSAQHARNAAWDGTPAASVGNMTCKETLVYRIALSFCVAGALTGCKKTDNQDPPASKTAEGNKPAMDKPAASYPAAFDAWDMASRNAAWQGAWAGDGGSLGWKAAWQITGDQIDYFDGKGEKHMTFALESPCTAKFAQTGKNGTEWTVTTYTINNGQLITGLGDAGQKKGDQAVVCGGGKIFTVDAKGCTEWEENFGKMESKPGDCGFAKDGFHYKSYGNDTTLLVDGDTIWSDQLKATHATKHPDLAAARKAQGL
jgi:hypothetical protein